jgi:hypothetical protein
LTAYLTERVSVQHRYLCAHLYFVTYLIVWFGMKMHVSHIVCLHGCVMFVSSW